MSLLANYPFFFDSPEYVNLSQLPYGEALYLAHPLVHPVSMLLWRVSYLIFGSSVAVLSLVSAAFWIMGAVFAARCVARERRWVVYAICLLLPLPWLIMTNVVVDAVSSSLLMCGVALLWKRRDTVRVAASTVLFGLSVLNYLGMAIWLPVPMALILFDSKLTTAEKVKKMTIVLGGVGIVMGGLLITFSATNFVGSQGGQAISMLSLTGFLVALYHSFTTFIANYTWVSVVVVLGYAITWLRKRDWEKLLIMVGIAGMYVVSLLPWHSGPYGRLGVFLVYPLAWLYSHLNKYLRILAIALILPSFFMTVAAYQETPLPILQQKLIERSECSGKQLVLSENQRPQLAGSYPQAQYIGSANWQIVRDEVVSDVDGGEVVCMSKQAIDYPYRQYEGQLPSPLVGRKGRNGFLFETLQTYKLVIMAEDPKHPELTLYAVSR